MIKTKNGETLFNVTNTYITKGVQSLIENEKIDNMDVYNMIINHTRNIDDNKYKEDVKWNLENVKHCGRVLSVYELKDNRFYVNSYISKDPMDEEYRIATETTVMLCDEY